uniref:Uncharacterized protein n=1 Tax=Arundo donax TaxID=35708 RepID=A0A0A9FZV8_ARUDO
MLSLISFAKAEDIIISDCAENNIIFFKDELTVCQLFPSLSNSFFIKLRSC